MSERALEVVRPGALTTVQDDGRTGFAHLGVPPSGALDQGAWALANRLVGNREGAAALETTLDGVAVRLLCDCAVAVTGASAAVRAGDRPAPWGAAVELRAGTLLEIGPASAGLRSYLAISGGLAVKPTLGSRSHDVLSGLGPPPLAAGDRIALGDDPGPPPALDVAPQPAPPTALELVLWDGPRRGWLSRAGERGLTASTWTVASASNRTGLRLDGPALPLGRRQPLRSEGMVIGAVQVPPDGRPIIFLRDHPTTGGYPVVGVIDPAQISACAQARPGTPVRLHTRSLPGAAR